jgi:Glycosyltransferase
MKVFCAFGKRVLPHGIDLKVPGSTTTYPDSGKKKSTFDILYVGGLTRHKGAHILINAFKAVEYPQARLHIVGAGINEDEFKKSAAGDTRIVFHGKFDNSGLSRFYEHSDIVVVPSIWYEVRSNVIPEAFRAGIPVIGSSIGAIPEFIKDGYNGFLFEPGDEKRLRAIITEIILDPARLRVLGDNASKSVKEYEMSGYIDSLIGIYDSVLKKNKRE